MTTNPTPISPEIWNLAQAILTQKQLLVLELREQHGYSWNQLAVHLNCTRANVREIHRAATRNLYNTLERNT
jgi:transcriptional regulator